MGLIEFFAYRLTVHFRQLFTLNQAYISLVPPIMISIFTFMPTFIIRSVVSWRQN